MTHYAGKLSKRPLLVACSTKTPQATSQDWRGTDCIMCKLTLMGLLVAQSDDTRERRTVVDLTPDDIVLAVPPLSQDDDAYEPSEETLTWEEFGERYVVAADPQ